MGIKQAQSLFDLVPLARLAHDYFCLADIGISEDESQKSRHYTVSMFKTKLAKRRFNPRTIKVRSICGSSERKMVHIAIKSFEHGTFIALVDIVTGSFYNLRTGRCLSGNLHIVRENL